MVFKNQFKKAYSVLTNAILKTQADLGGNTECYYWNDIATERPNPCTAACFETNEFGSCTKSLCEDGSALGSDWNGMMGQCTAFANQLFDKNLKIVKSCKGNALRDGCLPVGYYGVDKVRKDNSPDSTPDPGANFSTSDIQTKNGVFLIAGDIMLLTYGTNGGSSPYWTIDINGHKGPNKWGYDIFSFQIKGNQKNGIMGLYPLNRVTEKGGVSSTVMYEDMYSK